MIMEYPIKRGDRVVGKASAERSGLYLEVKCQCNFTDQSIHRIVLIDGNDQIDLGICVPEGDVFTLRRGIPLKKLTGQSIRFTVDGVMEKKREEIAGNPSFSVAVLKQALLRCEDGKWLVITEAGNRYSVQDLQGSGQTP